MSTYSNFFRTYKAIPGIYKITNKLTEESYVGASSNIGRRFCQHLGSNDLPIQKAIQELGPDRFQFEILEVTATDLASREKYWIAKLKPSYNKNEGGNGGLTEASRLQKRKTQKALHASPEYKEKQRKSMVKSEYILPNGTHKLLRVQDVGRYQKKGIYPIKVE